MSALERRRTKLLQDASRTNPNQIMRVGSGKNKLNDEIEKLFHKHAA